MSTETQEILSAAQVDEIETRAQDAKLYLEEIAQATPVSTPDPVYAINLSLRDIPALIRSLRAAREEIERLKELNFELQPINQVSRLSGRVSRLEAACQSALDAIKRRDAVSLGDEVAKQLREALKSEEVEHG